MRLITHIIIGIAFTNPVFAADLILPETGQETESEESPFDDLFEVRSRVENGELTVEELVDLLEMGLSQNREAGVAELAELALGTPQDIRDEDARHRAALERTAERREGGKSDDSKYRGRSMFEGLAKYKSDARINNSAGAAYLLLNRGAAALQYLNTAIYLDPGFADPLTNLGLFYRIKGKYELALGQYEKALQLSPANPVTWYNKGIVFIRLGKIEESLDAFKKSAALDPKFRAPVRRMALVWLDIGDYEKADIYLQRLRYQLETTDENEITEEIEELNILLALTEKKLGKTTELKTDIND